MLKFVINSVYKVCTSKKLCVIMSNIRDKFIISRKGKIFMEENLNDTVNEQKTVKKSYKKLLTGIIILLVVCFGVFLICRLRKDDNINNDSNNSQIVYSTAEEVMSAFSNFYNNNESEEDLSNLIHEYSREVMEGYVNASFITSLNSNEDKAYHVKCTWDSLSLISNENLDKCKKNYSDEEKILEIFNSGNPIYECRVRFESVIYWFDTYIYLVQENNGYKIFAYSTKMAEEYIINNAKSMEYLDFARNVLAHKGEAVKFTGKVVQALYGENTVDMLLAITKDEWGYYEDNICILYDMEEGENKVLDGDIITVYGIMSGEYSYTSAWNIPITIPTVRAVKVTIDN